MVQRAELESGAPQINVITGRKLLRGLYGRLVI
jgi:hypothetical protein